MIFLAHARRAGAAFALFGCLFGSLLSSPARALPSFAQQTGMECAGCHVGGFGPQLTPAGMKFKIGGYTDSNGQGMKMPLAAMLVEGFTHSNKDLPSDPAQGFGRNSNFALQELSVFLAGGVGKHVGGFVQATYSGVDDKMGMDNVDLRLTDTQNLFGHNVVYGISLNNNPTVQDPFNSVPAWRFPYMSADLANSPAAAPLIDGGLEQQVLGLTTYAYVGDFLLESGGYFSPSESLLEDMNVASPDAPATKLKNGAPYWRLAWFKDLHKQAFSLGTFGLTASVQPDRFAKAADGYTDVGFDANWQWFPSRRHAFTVNSSFIHEVRSFNASVAAGGADHLDTDLEQFKVAAAYYYRQRYGATVGFFDTWGGRDRALYGSRTGLPDSRGVTLQGDWTPFGQETSWGAPWANARVGVQYTLYNQFDGASDNYDGAGRDASDNNTLFCFLWMAI